MGRYRENISSFLARLTYYLGVKLRLVAIGRSPVLQTSPSTSSLIGSSDRTLIYSTL